MAAPGPWRAISFASGCLTGCSRPSVQKIQGAAFQFHALQGTLAAPTFLLLAVGWRASRFLCGGWEGERASCTLHGEGPMESVPSSCASPCGSRLSWNACFLRRAVTSWASRGSCEAFVLAEAGKGWRGTERSQEYTHTHTHQKAKQGNSYPFKNRRTHDKPGL